MSANVVAAFKQGSAFIAAQHVAEKGACGDAIVINHGRHYTSVLLSPAEALRQSPDPPKVYDLTVSAAGGIDERVIRLKVYQFSGI